MKLTAKSLAWLAPLLLTACFHKTGQQPVQALPPAVDAVPKPEPTLVELPPSVLTIPSQPLETAPTPQPPAPRVKHKKTTKPVTSSVNDNSQQASLASPVVSAIGQLSSGESPDLRQQTVNSIFAIERDLNGLGNKLSSQQQKTAAQIRAFLKQAKEAMASGDVDGAHTLAAKAKVLLSELGS